MAFGRAHRVGTMPKSTSVKPPVTPEKPDTDRSATSASKENNELYAIMDEVRGALVEIIDAKELDHLAAQDARVEIAKAIRRILARRPAPLPSFMVDRVVDELVDDVLGFGPLEPLLAQDELTDIMVNGPKDVYVELGGRIQKVNVQFRDETHLLNICQRIVSLVGRRVDESSPICDARLPDGSRVNVIAPPLWVLSPVLWKSLPLGACLKRCACRSFKIL